MKMEKGDIVQFKNLEEVLSLEFLIHNKGFCSFFVDGGYYECYFRDIEKFIDTEGTLEYEEEGFIKIKESDKILHKILLKDE